MLIAFGIWLLLMLAVTVAFRITKGGPDYEKEEADKARKNSGPEDTEHNF